jgi:hypothetical protein
MSESGSDSHFNILISIYPIYKWGLPLTPSSEILAVLKPSPYNDLYDTIREMYWVQTYYMSDYDPRATNKEHMSTDQFKTHISWIEAWTKMLDGFTISFDKQTSIYLFNILKDVLLREMEGTIE